MTLGCSVHWMHTSYQVFTTLGGIMVYVGGYHECIGRCSVHWRDIDRPIRVLSCVCKFFCNLLNTTLTGSLNKNNIIHNTQIGFFENHRASDHVFTLKSTCQYN